MQQQEEAGSLQFYWPGGFNVQTCGTFLHHYRANSGGDLCARSIDHVRDAFDQRRLLVGLCYRWGGAGFASVVVRCQAH